MKECITADEAIEEFSKMMILPPSKREPIYFNDMKDGEVEKFTSFLILAQEIRSFSEVLFK